MRRKRAIKALALTGLIVILMSYGLQQLSYSINPFLQLQESVNSPSGAYAIEIYLSDAGATTSYAIIGVRVNKKTRWRKKIYTENHQADANVYWLSDKAVVINGIKLNIFKDKYKRLD